MGDRRGRASAGDRRSTHALTALWRGSRERGLQSLEARGPAEFAKSAVKAAEGRGRFPGTVNKVTLSRKQVHVTLWSRFRHPVYSAQKSDPLPRPERPGDHGARAFPSQPSTLEASRAPSFTPRALESRSESSRTAVGASDSFTAPCSDPVAASECLTARCSAPVAASERLTARCSAAVGASESLTAPACTTKCVRHDAASLRRGPWSIRNLASTAMH